MKYFYDRNGKKEDVTLERWGWHALYNDGGELKQFDDAGAFHQVQEIDQNKIKIFRMYRTEQPGIFIDVVVAGKQIFQKYIRTTFSANSPDEKKVTTFVFGYVDKETKKTHYNYILPNDSVVISDFEIIIDGEQPEK